MHGNTLGSNRCDFQSGQASDHRIYQLTKPFHPDLLPGENAFFSTYPVTRWEFPKLRHVGEKQKVVIYPLRSSPITKAVLKPYLRTHLGEGRLTRKFHVDPPWKTLKKPPRPQTAHWTKKAHPSFHINSMDVNIHFKPFNKIFNIITHLSSPKLMIWSPFFSILLNHHPFDQKVRTIKPRTNLTGYPANTPDTAWTAALDLFRIFTHRLEKKSGKGYTGNSR